MLYIIKYWRMGLHNEYLCCCNVHLSKDEQKCKCNCLLVMNCKCKSIDILCVVLKYHKLANDP